MFSLLSKVLAQATAFTSSTPKNVNGVALLADGTHCTIHYSQYGADTLHPGDDFVRRNYYSFKLKAAALNTQVTIDCQ